jgi:hypothetical protein
MRYVNILKFKTTTAVALRGLNIEATIKKDLFLKSL